MNAFFRNSPAPTPPERKRHQIQSVMIGDESFWRKVAKLKSPVENEPEPKFMINFHCREREGKPFMSYTLAASPSDLACSLAYWILDAAEKMKFEPKEFATRLCSAVHKAVDSLNEEEPQTKENK